MDTPYESLIANERAKIEVLKAKIKECERRIATFQSLQSSDDLDALLERQLNSSPTKNEVAAGQDFVLGAAPIAGVEHIGAESDGFPKKALNSNSIGMLRFASTTDKSIDEFLRFAKERGITDSRQRVRAFLHQYKTTYGLLTSDRDGFFRLSDKGVAYLASLTDAQPTQEGFSSAS